MVLVPDAGAQRPGPCEHGATLTGEDKTRHVECLTAGRKSHFSSTIRPSASTTARQTAAPQRTVNRRSPASAPSPASTRLATNPNRMRRHRIGGASAILREDGGVRLLSPGLS